VKTILKGERAGNIMHNIMQATTGDFRYETWERYLSSHLIKTVQMKQVATVATLSLLLEQPAVVQRRVVPRSQKARGLCIEYLAADNTNALAYGNTKAVWMVVETPAYTL